MEIKEEQAAKKSAIQLIAEQTQLAREALARAEALAREHNVGFSFEIGDGYGWYSTGTYNNEIYGFWDGWQGSSC